MKITETGTYKTRNGDTVTVDRIGGDETFKVKGKIHQMFRGKVRPRGYHIWKPNGQYMAVGEHKNDIVEKL